MSCRSWNPGGAERQVVLLASAMPRDRAVAEAPSSSGQLGLESTPRARRAWWCMPWGPLGSGMSVVSRSRFKGYVWSCATCGSSADAATTSSTPGSFRRTRSSRSLDRSPASASSLPGRRSLSRWKARFGWPRRLMDAWARRMADAIVANSDAVAEDAVRVERLRRDRVHVIRNGIESAPPPTERDRADWAELRRSAGVPAGPGRVDRLRREPQAREGSGPPPRCARPPAAPARCPCGDRR